MAWQFGITIYTAWAVSFLTQIRWTVLHTWQRQKDQMIESIFSIQYLKHTLFIYSSVIFAVPLLLFLSHTFFLHVFFYFLQIEIQNPLLRGEFNPFFKAFAYFFQLLSNQQILIHFFSELPGSHDDS
jgi:hypothetical protein